MTSPYHVNVSPIARQQFLQLPAKSQKTIIKIAEALAINPRPPGAKKIEGMTGLYVEVVEHFRLIYKIEDHEVLLLVIK